MRYVSDKRLDRVIRDAVDAGWAISRGGKHWKLKSPGGLLVAVSVTPSDHRTFENVRHHLGRINAAEQRHGEAA